MPKLIEILEFFDNSGNVMIKRLPEDDNAEIKWGAQLTVRENQKVVFIKDGKIAKFFDSGRYVLNTKNIPVLTKLVTGLVYGKESPFRAEVYFISLKLFRDFKWGTSEPILYRDSELEVIRLRANGSYSIEIENPELFFKKIIGTQGLFNQNEISNHLRSVIISNLATTLGNQLDTVFNLSKRYIELGKLIKDSVSEEFSTLGLRIFDFHINSISVPTDVQKFIDSKSGMKAVGDLNNFLKFKTANSIDKGNGNSSNQGIEAGIGIGLGMSMTKILSNETSSSRKLNNEDVFEKIKKLKELFDMEAISKEEFEKSKKQLLSQI